ncbi:MAG: sulfurtransferase, partial [Actinobacteria bacterium]|nr:sulfurtransferase [Actinomycetota bacterium]NIU71059.1 sulfurtransferase [Actinomycetota bacterium]NIW33004.1 sulfurtransferase [Actinomycetota bacterium]NIX25153.1 sulfurtransferase [Actinomycetota bacterium]
MEQLVTTAWLAEQLGDPDLVVLDCSVIHELGEDDRLRFTSGRNEFDQAHIPTARFADLTEDLSDPDSRLRFALPSPER